MVILAQIERLINYKEFSGRDLYYLVIMEVFEICYISYVLWSNRQVVDRLISACSRMKTLGQLNAQWALQKAQGQESQFRFDRLVEPSFIGMSLSDRRSLSDGRSLSDERSLSALRSVHSNVRYILTWFENACAATMTKFKITKILKPYKKFIISLIPPSTSFYIIIYFFIFFLILRPTGALVNPRTAAFSFSYKNIRWHSRKYTTYSSLPLSSP